MTVQFEFFYGKYPQSSSEQITRLSAISNCKLAQLSFAPPSDSTLKKTALVKNLVDTIYNRVSSEHLKKMTRWTYFTPESLEDTTQQDIEEIVYRYSQIIYYTSNINPCENDQKFLFIDYPERQEEDFTYYSTLFSHPDFRSSKEFLNNDNAPQNSSKVEIDGLPAAYQSVQPQKYSGCWVQQNNNSSNDTITNDTNKNSSTNRSSWISDTGVYANSALAVNLAHELMTLFDMEFRVDLSLPDSKKGQSTNNGSSTTLHQIYTAITDTQQKNHDSFEGVDLYNYGDTSQSSTTVYEKINSPCYYSSPSDSDSEKEQPEINGYNKVTRKKRPNSSYAEYRKSLESRFELSEDETFETASSYTNDTIDTFEYHLSYYMCQDETCHSRDSAKFKGLLHALSRIKSARSSTNSIKENSINGQVIYNYVPDVETMDASHQEKKSKKQNPLLQNIMNFVGRRKCSKANKKQPLSPTAIFVNANTESAKQEKKVKEKTYASFASPIRLPPYKLRQHRTRIISFDDTDCDKELQQNTNNMDFTTDMASSQNNNYEKNTFSFPTMPLQRAKSSSSLKSIFKRLNMRKKK